MLFPFPLKVMEAVGELVVVKPFATEPGETQLDVVPVKAKLFKVPVLMPVASVKVLKVGLLNPATP